MPPAPGPVMLGRIACVTFSAPDLDAVEAAYTGHLQYKIQLSTEVTPEQAELWGCQAMSGASCLLMSPAASSDFVFRFVQRDRDPGYVPYTTYGWSASELIVENVDALAERLADSPFQIIGPPKNLAFSNDIRAMQVMGPASEILYLTELKNRVPGLDIPAARCAVDRTFIVILAGRSIQEIQKYYHGQFGVAETPIMESRITVVSKAFGLPVEQRYPIAALSLRDQSFIEVDEFPDAARPRDVVDAMLPPGMAMVSFDCSRLPQQTSTQQRFSFMPYQDRTAACCTGVAGEMLELLLPK